MIAPFTLHRPTTLDEATSLLSELEDASPYAGGTELLQVMKLGLARFEQLVDLKQVPELGGIRDADGDGVRLGATVTHRELERSPLVRDRLPALGDLERQVANVRVRNVGTLGGNLCFAEPHSDPAALLVACGAAVELAGPEGTRRLPLGDFLVDAFATDLREGELLTAVVVPRPTPGARLTYRRLALAERPTASVACRLDIAEGRVDEAAIVVGAVGPVPLRCRASDELAGLAVGELGEAVRDVAASCADEAEVEADVDAAEDYKRQLVGVLVQRAVRDALVEGPPDG